MLLKDKFKLWLPETLLAFYLPGHPGCCWPSLFWQGRSCMQRAPAKPGAPCTVQRSIQWPWIPGRNKATEKNTYRCLKRMWCKKAFQPLSWCTHILESLLTSFISCFGKKRSLLEKHTHSILFESIRLLFVCFSFPFLVKYKSMNIRLVQRHCSLLSGTCSSLKALSLMLEHNRPT